MRYGFEKKIDTILFYGFNEQILLAEKIMFRLYGGKGSITKVC